MLKNKDYDNYTITFGGIFYAKVQLEIKTIDDLFEIKKKINYEYIFLIYAPCVNQYTLKKLSYICKK